MAENILTSSLHSSYTEPLFQFGFSCITVTFMWVCEYTTSFPGEPQSQPVLEFTQMPTLYMFVKPIIALSLDPYGKCFVNVFCLLGWKLNSKHKRKNILKT